MKKIFVSQSEKDNGRNRGIRKLTAKLDSENGFNSLNSNQDTGEENISFCQKPDTAFHKTSPIQCPYYKTTCPENIHHYSMKCVFGFNNCQIKKWYDRYKGLDINFLGI